MSFVKTKKFKYFKNLMIGVGAAIVLMGALFKLESLPYASQMLTAGLTIEAIIFLFLGIIGPEPDYYWDKLYPGIEDYHSNITPLTAGDQGKDLGTPLHGDVIESQLGGMLVELQGMSQNLSSLKALQEVDFSGTSDQIKSMNNFYTKLNEAMANLSDSLEDTKAYRVEISNLNNNLSGLNSVYGGMLNAMAPFRPQQ